MNSILLTTNQYSVEGAEAVSTLVADAWTYTWQIVMQSGFYSVMANLGALIGLCCLMFFLVNLAKEWLEKESIAWALDKLIFPLVVVFLLANGGGNLAAATMGMRSLINYYNEQVLASFSANLSFEQALSRVADYSSVKTQLEGLRDQCNVLINEETLTQCLESQAQLANQIVSDYEENHPGEPMWVGTLRYIRDVYQVDPADPIGSAARLSTAPLVEGIRGIAGLGSDVFLRAIESFLIASQAAFQYVIELSMLVVGMMGPLAVGSSLLPTGTKPLYAWLSGFASLGMCKLSLNIMTGLFALMTVKLGPMDALPNAIVIGVLAPVLAFGIATGGGMAVFSGITAAAASGSGWLGSGGIVSRRSR
jgi:hypothetical protein